MPEAIIRDLSEFLGLEFSEEMLDPSNQAGKLIRSDEVWKNNSRSRIAPSQGKYKELFSADEIAWMEEKLLKVDLDSVSNYSRKLKDGCSK